MPTSEFVYNKNKRYLNMIHEVLFNLWNNAGDASKSHLLELQEFLHPGERNLIIMILEIASDYHEIVAFINKVLNNATLPTETISDKSSKQTLKEVPIDSSTLKENSTDALSGLYIKAFCSGVDKVLSDYRKEIIKLENMFLEYPQLPLTFILSSVEKYRSLFEVLKLMIHKIQIESLHGCLIMGNLYTYIGRGLDRIEKAVNQIIQSINIVFYQHLCNWIIYGDIVDICNEFFICDGNVPDEDFLYPEQIAKLNEDSGSRTLIFKKGKIRRPPPIQKFYIKWHMVPMFINKETAESILFMGRIVWIIRNDPKKVGDENYRINYKRDIWEGKDVEYYMRLQALESQSFDTIGFKSVIEEYRIKLTKYLWNLMLDEGNLIEHLQLIRDYYALGRGELFQQFITVADDHIKDISSESILQNLNFVFLETARKMYGENDKSYLRFEITSCNSEVSKTNPWSRLQLNFEINWPLHIIFHPKVMELYNELFCFLLRMKKTQINLNKLWSKHISSKQGIDRRVWTLRQHLMFLVNNLQYYMQVDVIEAQFSLLLKAVQNANEFEDIIKVHHTFVSNLLAKTFLLMPDESYVDKSKHCLYQTPALQFNVPTQVYNVITKLLSLCDEFCETATNWNDELTEPDLIELETLQTRSDTIIESLLFILNSLCQKFCGGHLLQLLLQLDFNGYLTKNKVDLNLSLM